MGLSSDPAKRRRQLENLAAGADRRAASIRSRIAEIDAAGEESIEAAIEEPIEEPKPRSGVAAIEEPIEEGSRIGRGRMGPPPAPTTPAIDEAGEDAPAAVPAGDVDQELELEEELEVTPAPSSATRILAAALGVKK